MFFWLIFLFLLGLILGSLINVVVYRREKNKSFVSGRSYCPKCKKQINWYDNIPIVSFILLKRHCRYCGKKISWQYPIVELSLGILVVWFFYVRFLSNFITLVGIENWTIENWLLIITQLLFSLLIVGVLASIFVYDLKHFVIPDKFVLFGSVIAIAYALFIDFYFGFFIQTIKFGQFYFLSSATLRGMVGALVAGGFFFWLVWISKEKWMGWGDVKFAILMGLLLGFPVILIGLFIAYLLGATIGITLMILGKKKMQSEIPFGPFLCAGTFLGMIYGEKIIGWYLGVLH